MANYSWTVSPGGTVTAGGGVNDNIISVNWNLVAFPPVPSAQTVSVNYENANGCSAAADKVLDVKVFKLPQTGPQYHIENNWNP
jgi:hypothetical protein